jgi:glycosyltransferase involved in cell wall biosynthesis
MVAISVIIEMFHADVESDVTVEEALGSLEEQDYPPEQVEFLIVTAEDTPAMRELVAKSFGRFASRVRVIATGARGYHQAKLRGIEQAVGQAIAFSDSDNIQPVCWLRCLHEQLLAAGHAAVTGPTSFKPGTFLRLAVFLADFGILREDGLEWTPYFWANNVGFRREVLLSFQLNDHGKFNRFGGSRFLARQMHDRGLRVRVDPRMKSVHGYSWRVFMYEKRLRRFVHLAYVRRHDPNSGLSALVGVPDRPLSWLWTWLAAAYRYQKQPSLCRKTLKLGPARRLLMRVLLAGLSVYELGLILYFAAAPGALRSIARKYAWWKDPAEEARPAAGPETKLTPEG